MLISESGNARVCDYGLSPFISGSAFTVDATSEVVGSSRWLAPEFIVPPGGASKAADIFAFAMLAAEVYTGKHPFGDVSDASATVRILCGERSHKPQAEQFGLTLEMWRFIERCWQKDPDKRPSADEVVSVWEGFVNGYAVLSFGPLMESQRSHSMTPELRCPQPATGIRKRGCLLFGTFSKSCEDGHS